MVKRFSQLILAILLIGTSTPSVAVDDEAWIVRTNPEVGNHSLVIQEKTQFFRTFPRLENWNSRTKVNTQCDSILQRECATSGQYHAHYPVCDDKLVRDCISKFSVIDSTGRELVAEFERYIYTDHVGDFVGDGRRAMLEVESPSIWRIPEAPHQFGDKYLVVAGQDGAYGSNWTAISNYAEIYAIELASTDCIGPACVPNCAEGCAGVPPERFNGLNCLFNSGEGFCAVHRPFPSGIRLSLEIRAGLKPAGWFHGRMTKPEISIRESNNQQVISIAAEPVRVPIMFFPSTQYKQLNPTLKAFWDDCLKAATCPTATRVPNSIEDKNIWPFGERRQVETDFPASHPDAIFAVQTFAPLVGDQSVAAPSYWSYRTLFNDINNNPCFARTKGVQGIVTTNAIAYEDSAPKFQRGFLNYKVAGLHYLPDGSEAMGSYDLVMRSELARCLYGFSKGAVSATITVSGDGDKDIATTVVGEKNGWLKLAAYGFTFSQKTIQVKLTQAKRTTITCVSLADPKKTRKVTAPSPKCPAGFKQK